MDADTLNHDKVKMIVLVLEGVDTTRAFFINTWTAYLYIAWILSNAVHIIVRACSECLFDTKVPWCYAPMREQET